MQNWDFWALTLGCTSKLFSIHRGFGIFKCCSSWTFPVYDKDGQFFFFFGKQAWTILLNFSQFTKELGNWDFWSPLYVPLPYLKPSSYSKKMHWGQGWQISKEFYEKKLWFHSFRSSQFCSVSNVFALAWVWRTNTYWNCSIFFFPKVD